jgi:hypothetical protein
MREQGAGLSASVVSRLADARRPGEQRREPAEGGLLLGAARGQVTAAAETVPEWSPDEYRAEFRPGQVLHGTGPDVRLAVFGTFDPAWLVLLTIGALELGDGRYLLARWRRHPVSPDYSPFLVLPDLEPLTVWDALIEVLPYCAADTTAADFAGVCAPEELARVVSEAITEVTGRRPETWDGTGG